MLKNYLNFHRKFISIDFFVENNRSFSLNKWCSIRLFEIFFSLVKLFFILFCFHREYEMSFYMVFCLNETKKRRYCFDKSDRFSSVSKSRSATCYDFVYCSIQIENYSRGNKKRKHQGESFELYHLYLFVISLWMWMVVVVVVLCKQTELWDDW